MVRYVLGAAGMTTRVASLLGVLFLLAACGAVTDAERGTSLATEGITTVGYGGKVCGGAPSVCQGASKLDVAASELTYPVKCTPGATTTTPAAVELATKRVSRAAVERVVRAVGALRVREDQKVEVFDGSMVEVSVVYGDGVVRTLSPEATCGGTFDQILAGEDEVRAAFAAAQAE